jgi:hypothetical protein
MDEDRKRLWEVRLGLAGWTLTLLGTAATLAGILVGVWQFNEGQREKAELENSLLLRKDEIEFQRRLWLERLSAYRSVAETAGKIVARLDDAEKLKEAVQEFTAAYWGSMIMVEDKAVESAMIDFMLELHDFEIGWSTANKIKISANELIKACRKSAEDGALQL